MNPRGSLVCVGIGMTLGSHLTPLARSYIEAADVVFVAASNGIIELWLKQMHPDVRSLQPFYRVGKSRAATYRDMVAAMLKEVRMEKNVCGAFYGHPGVFASPTHTAIRAARKEGYRAHMEPGISAEDCLYADLGIDPGAYGCQHYEASQLMLHRKRIDPSSYLVLWQVGIAGDRSLGQFTTCTAYRQVLIDVLARNYPLEHRIILYEAAILPIHQARIERTTLARLIDVPLAMHTTMIVPPAEPLFADAEITARLSVIDSTSSSS